MNNEAFVNAAKQIGSEQAELDDRLAELKAAYIADNRVLECGQRVWVDNKLYSLSDVNLVHYKQHVLLTYTLWPDVDAGSGGSRSGGSIQLLGSYMEDWENVSVEKP